jgi:hypothetical protein
MIERYLSDLAAALDSVGIRGPLRRRILLETEDHLRSDPDWPARFGSPTVVAARFADELAVARSRGAANATFLALAVAGAVYAASFLLADRGADIFAGGFARVVLALSAGTLAILMPQLAFVAGVLAGLRSLRLRRAAVVPAAEVRLLRRQTATALAAGWVTLASLATFAATKGGPEPDWWIPAVLGAVGGAALPLAWATVRVRRAVALRPRTQGDGGDAYDDLDLVIRRRMDLRDRPWLFCAVVAALAGVATFAAAAIGAQPDEGVRNGIAEAVAVFAGFWLFGEPLGLRPSR